MSWTQPPFSLSPLAYTVSLTRVTGSGNGQVLCTGDVDSRPVVTTAATLIDFISLEEFSTYRITVTARFSAFGLSPEVPSSLNFITLKTGMSINIYHNGR